MTKARTRFGGLLAVICVLALMVTGAAPAFAHHKDDHPQGQGQEDPSSEGEREHPQATGEEDPEGKRYDGEGEPRGESEPSCPNPHQGNDGDSGANASGPYDNTCDGSASKNGNGGGSAQGRPCAGCVGNADDKNPPGQMPDGNHDGNAGYECDANNGVGRSNPAHTGCEPTTTPLPSPSPAPPVLPNRCPTNPDLPMGHKDCNPSVSPSFELCPAGTDNAGLPMTDLKDCNKDDVLGRVDTVNPVEVCPSGPYEGMPMTSPRDCADAVASAGDSVLPRFIVNSAQAVRGATRRAAGAVGAVLPFTGAGDALLLVGAALALIGSGTLTLRARRND